MGVRMKQSFSKEDTQWPVVHENMFNITNYQGKYKSKPQ